MNLQVLIPQLTQAEAGKPAVWLDIVWSLVLLDQANAEHISSVLTDNFIDSLESKLFCSKQICMTVLGHIYRSSLVKYVADSKTVKH